MATFRAVSAVSDSIIHILASRYNSEDFNLNPLEFRVYMASDFATPMEAGVSVFLYRIYVNTVQRTPPGRIGPDGRRFRSPLPLDLHFLITAWGRDASLQHSIAGWMMRVLEDTPSLPAGLLNHGGLDIFAPDETVELAVAEIDTETLFRIWEVIGSNSYQISVPYIARGVRIESDRQIESAGPVQERIFDYQRLGRT
jgi:hypothetical protein